MKTVLCYGDSNTWGYDAVNDSRFSWEERYTGVLSKLLGGGYHVVEHGLCGRTTQYDSQSEQYVNGLKEAEVCARINEPISIAMIMLGTNDCKEVYGVMPAEITKGAALVAETFEKRGARIILAAPASIKEITKSPFYNEFGRTAETKSQKLPELYRSLSRRRGWVFLNADQLLVPGEYDGIHLKKDDHRRLAEEIYKKILRMEEQ